MCYRHGKEVEERNMQIQAGNQKMEAGNIMLSKVEMGHNFLISQPQTSQAKMILSPCRLPTFSEFQRFSLNNERSQVPSLKRIGKISN